jgi:lipopolysaccharide/colanic/teichoic acid biosynthesis glycosyltransferase
MADVQRGKYTFVVVDSRNESADAILKILYDIRPSRKGFSIIPLAEAYENIFDRVPVSLVSREWVLSVTSVAPHRFYSGVKRIIDIIAALVAGGISLSFYPLVILAIKCEDGGPIFYRPLRIGRNNHLFNMVKFRSMTGLDEGMQVLKTTHTVTRVGGIIRKTRIDEFPQFWNVLKGDLSFVGPRPEHPALVEEYTHRIPHYNLRHLVKPGLSGWAQINDFNAPRGGTDIEKTTRKLSYDLYYIKNRSLLLDIIIILKTIKALFIGSGA